MDRDDRNHPSKQGYPSRGGIRRKPMTKSRMRRTGSGYKASVVWVTRPGTGTPDRHSERHAGKSDAAGRRRHVLPREVSSSVQSSGLPHGQLGGKEREKSAEAIVAQPG